MPEKVNLLLLHFFFIQKIRYFYSNDLGSFQDTVSEAMLKLGSYIHLHYRCCGLALAGQQVPPKLLCHSSSAGQGTGNTMKGLQWVRTRSRAKETQLVEN